MGKETIKRRIEKILEDGPEDTLRIMDKLKRYRDCPTTQQLAQMMRTYFQHDGEVPSICISNSGNVKVWTLRDSN